MSDTASDGPARDPAATGVICLQGGVELTPSCEPMDRQVLDRSGSAVAVLAGAARPGSDYEGASARATAHYEWLGATVTVIPDPRRDAAASLDALDRTIDLIVLPGGSPGGLLGVLVADDNGIVGRRIVDLWREGVGISGASAGAMVLCAHTPTPGRAAALAFGLGLVPGMAIPHWTPGSERRWSLPDVLLWGLPECGGALIDGDQVLAVGEAHPSIHRDGEWQPLPRDAPMPLPPE